MRISKQLAQKIADHLNPKKNYQTKLDINIGKDYVDERHDLLLKDIEEINRVDNLEDSLTWLVKIYSSVDKLFTDCPRDATNIKDGINEILLKIASFKPDKSIQYQISLLTYLQAWIADDTKRSLAYNICSKLLELQGTIATEDGENLNIQHYIVKLDTKVHNLRKEVFELLLSNFQITSPINQVRILEILANGFSNGINARFRGQISNFAFEEINYTEKFIIRYLVANKEKHTLNPEFYDVLAKIYNISERISEYKELGYESKNIAQLTKLVEDYPSFLLFQSLFHPNFRYISKNKELSPTDVIQREAEMFKLDQQDLLVHFLEYAQKQGAIYNSIKTFFRELGRIRPDVSENILKTQLVNQVGSFWYYAGHAIGSLIQNPQYVDFSQKLIQDLSKSNDVLKKKAIVDVLTELTPDNTDKRILHWCLIQLESAVDSTNEQDRNNWHFKWSVTEASEKVFTKTTSKFCFRILEKCIEKVNGLEENNQIIYDRVASTIFGLELHNKLDKSYSHSLVALLQYFISSGRNSLDVETFYQVVAKYDINALLDFVIKKIESKVNQKASLDMIPFDWKFVFENIPDDLLRRRKTATLKQIIQIALSHKFTYPLVLHLDRIWASLQKKFGNDIGYDVLETALAENNDTESVDKLLYLLEEVEDYDNPRYWQILKDQVKTENPKIAERIHSVIFTGSFSSTQEDYRKKWLITWIKSGDPYLVEFAEKVLNSLEKLRGWG